jgi:hypothetical protein
MRRPYLLLAAAVVALGLALTVLGHPRRADTRRLAPAAAPMVELAITIGAGEVSPAVTSVPKGSRVRLRVEHRGAATARLALAGYEDRLEIPALEPGTVWTVEFLADRPGEDFAWLLDGQPAGRLMVTGSHLVEGHR